MQALQRCTVHDHLVDSYSGQSDADAISRARQQIRKALAWVKARQLLGHEGDWRIYRPHISPGAFSFQEQNRWFPDLDDTAAAVTALIKEGTTDLDSDCIIAAVEWMLGMQCSDGGWASYEVDNNKLYINKIPFSDMNSFADPSTADITARVVEALSLILQHLDETNSKQRPSETRIGRRHDRIWIAVERAIDYLVSQQEHDGSWYGRWGCNYIFGTSTVLCSLEYFRGRNKYEVLDDVVQRGIDFLDISQNGDGGWGESSLSYKTNKDKASQVSAELSGLTEAADSTASQTAWALMALVAYRAPSDPTVMKGIRYLLDTQTCREQCSVQYKQQNASKGDSPLLVSSGRSWPETAFTGTGFPNHCMLRYEYYRHHFPMMALGRFLAKAKKARLNG
ncbi:hypothetical protein LTR51_001182 [Lithohypha guttulata]|nr:hypothetical protein LTR51_001182 [Lithohypha guttulata]